MRATAQYSTVSFVVHSGNIMAILEHYAVPRNDYFSYAVDNSCGFVCSYEDGIITILGTI